MGSFKSMLPSCRFPRLGAGSGQPQRAAAIRDVILRGLYFRFFFDAPSHTGRFTVTLWLTSFLSCKAL